VNRFGIPAVILSAATLLSAAAQAMEIRQYDKMAGPDQDAYVATLVIGAQKVLIDEGKSADAAKINKLFTQTLPGDKTTVGLGEFDSNLDRARVADAENVVKNPNTQRIEVEDAFAVTMQANGIDLPDSFFTANVNFRPKHPPKQ
jgi:hypothetical protein